MDVVAGLLARTPLRKVIGAGASLREGLARTRDAAASLARPLARLEARKETVYSSQPGTQISTEKIRFIHELL
jgi:hypothetical protein